MSHSYQFYYDAPTIPITIDQMKKPFMSFIKKIEPVLKDFGVVKCKIQDASKLSEYKRPLNKMKRVKKITEQKFLRTTVNGIYIIDSEDVKYEPGIKPAQCRDDLKGHPLTKKFENCSIEEFMKYFWQNVTEIKTIYANGLPDTLFRQDDKIMEIWNPNRLCTFSDRFPSIFGQGRGVMNIEGVTNSYSYLGAIASAFGLHVEDLILYAFSYNDGPSSKLWIIISPLDSDNLEKFLHKEFPEEFENCPGFIQHKLLMIDTDILEENNIKYTIVEQKANEIVILAPNVYHYGWNLGYNAAEAVNFATEEWLEVIKNRNPLPCVCSQ